MVGKKVFVAISGGVDSSVAATLLKERGFDVIGIHMKMWGPQDSSQLPAISYQPDPVCRQQTEDRRDAMRVAAKLDIPFQTWDFTEEYRSAVAEYMIREYAIGRTPNPDVMCNSRIKFGIFLERALARGAHYIATGHYVRLMRKPETRPPSAEPRRGRGNPKPETISKLEIPNSKLLAAKDLNKDQSYFLWTLTQEQLRYCLFPIGEYTKPEVRELARKFGLPTAEKPDSQGICFIGEIDVRDFLKLHIPTAKGCVLTTAGRAVGEHEGAAFYTIGQRQGLGIGGGIPYYVAEKDAAANILVVAEGPYDKKLFRAELTATDVNWVSGVEPKFPLSCEARIRYRQPLQPCAVQIDQNDQTDKIVRHREHSDSSGGAMYRAQRFNNLIVTFDEPQRAVTPGQSIVFYTRKSFDKAQDVAMLGGGIIA